MNIVRFNQALDKARAFLRDAPVVREEGLGAFLLIRDIYGRLRLLCPDLGLDKRDKLAGAWLEAVGSCGDAERPLWFDGDFFDSAALRNHSQLQELPLGGGAGAVKFLERGIVGSDWLEASFRSESEAGSQLPPRRIVFYGLKGGVGRSTALCIAARHFAKQGKKTLVLDMDLESPGLSGLLLPSGSLPGFGIADWFVEDALGQADDALLENMVADSPLATEWRAAVRVAPALGSEETDYLPKLARIYAEINRGGTGAPIRESFPDRFHRMLLALERQESPDLVLLDSRAGLHDIAATLLVRVPEALRLLFATHSPQTWLGYRQLFTHWQSFPANLPGFRYGLQMVDAMLPSSGQAAHKEQFLNSAFRLFQETIYEDTGSRPEDDTAYHFSRGDSDAPHWAPAIFRDARFMEFDPATDSSPFHADELIQASYGDFLRMLDARLDD